MRFVEEPSGVPAGFGHRRVAFDELVEHAGEWGEVVDRISPKGAQAWRTSLRDLGKKHGVKIEFDMRVSPHGPALRTLYAKVIP